MCSFYGVYGLLAYCWRLHLLAPDNDPKYHHKYPLDLSKATRSLVNPLNRSPGGTVSALANFTMFSNPTLRSPRSTPPT